MSDSQIECQDIYYIYYMSDKMKESTLSCQECMADRIIERHNAGIFVRQNATMYVRTFVKYNVSWWGSLGESNDVFCCFFMPRFLGLTMLLYFLLMFFLLWQRLLNFRGFHSPVVKSLIWMLQKPPLLWQNNHGYYSPKYVSHIFPSIVVDGYPLVICYIAIKNGHLQLSYLLKMVIFHSYVSLPQGSPPFLYMGSPQTSWPQEKLSAANTPKHALVQSVCQRKEWVRKTQDAPELG